MALDVSKADVWAGPIKDRPGGAATVLEALAQAGANLEFVIARRSKSTKGGAVIFVAPVKGAAQVKAAKAAGLKKADSMAPLRVAGPDKKGTGACLMAKLAEAKINVRGLSAAAIGRKFVMYLAFRSKADAAKAARILRKA